MLQRASSMTVDISVAAVLLTGFVLGLRHALDADHLAAMATFVSQEASVARSCLLGTFWGIGHTAALLVAGGVTIAFKTTISPAVESALESVVALVLIVLGVHVGLRALGGLRLHAHTHAHDGVLHRHAHVHLGGGGAHHHVHTTAIARRPLLMGVLHGLAGSAALMLLVLATIPSPATALLYVLVFGVGSTGGMVALSGLLGIPLALAARSRSPRGYVVMQLAAGMATAVVGLMMALG
ncbi:MAG: urease accessory protein [Candidatus Rokuibacteriota bacterium]